jgi:hypothetical protein
MSRKEVYSGKEFGVRATTEVAQGNQIKESQGG